ncbi:MAG: hypothetical protein ORN58_01725, partial [Sediminibacterium sp.]|nr:hypothetical protein [Sediminibacterium sp.]
NQEKNNIMGNLSHINSVKKANAVVESVEILWKEGKTIKDYITKGLITGRQESILNLHKKGYNAPQIAHLLDFELEFVKKIIDKK